MDIPKEISARLVYKSVDHQQRIAKVEPLSPCEDCGLELTDTRTVRLAPTQYPHLHWRKYCYTCKCVCVVGQDTWWKEPKELNADIRKTENFQKYFSDGK